jgi:hypothetical protein
MIILFKIAHMYGNNTVKKKDLGYKRGVPVESIGKSL